MNLSIRQKILVVFLALTCVVILAMLATYYAVFIRDIRELAHNHIAMAFEIMFDDFSTITTQSLARIEQFASERLADSLYVSSVLEEQYTGPQDIRDVRYWNHIHQLIERSRSLVHVMATFAPLIEATEILVYDRDLRIVALYRQEAGGTLQGMYLPHIHDGTFITHSPGEVSDQWQGIQDLPRTALPEGVPSRYSGPFPRQSTATFSRVQAALTLKFITPIVRRNELQGVCVIHRRITPQDVERYAYLSQTEVNIFAEKTLSVGTLPAQHMFSFEASPSPGQITFSSFRQAPQPAFSTMTFDTQKYYQGSLVLGDDEQQIVGAITVNFSRQHEKTRVRQLLTLVASVALVFAGLTTVACLGLSSKIVQPLQILEQAIERFRANDFTARAFIDSQDEIGMLAKAFNSMAIQLQEGFRQIQTQMEEIQAFSDEREHLVHDLSESNEQLHRQIAERHRVEEEIRILNIELESRVKQRTAELETVNQELKDFAYVVSHDLKAPLRGIYRLAQWLVQDYAGAFDDQGKEMVDLLIGRVKRMDNLIDGILEYSRIGRVMGDHEPVDTSQLVQEVTDMLVVPGHVTITFADQLPTIMGDRVRIAQVFQNLLSNAVKYLDKPAGHVSIHCHDDGDYWQFSVQDNGPGIEAKHYETVFQIFQTLKPRDECESTGVGLSIVKKIVEFYGGTIGVESVPGTGSTFWFTWPKAEFEVNSRALSDTQNALGKSC